MRRSLLLLSLISLFASGGAAAMALAATHSVPAHAATHLITVRPVTGSGTPATGFHAKHEKGLTIDCTGASASPGAVDANIDLCSPSAAYAIACWKSATAHQALCI